MSKTNVLFMQSQTYYGADSQIHGLLMRHLDREKFTVHAACNPGPVAQPSASLKALQKIPNLHLRPTNFGSSLNESGAGEIARSAVTGTLPLLGSLSALAGYIRKNKIHILHGTEKPRDAFYGLLLARMTGAKCLIHIHVKAEGWMSPLVRWAMHRADALVGVSSFVADSIVAMGYRSDRVHYVLNSLDTEQWQPSDDRQSIRREFKIPEDMPLLAIISRVFPWKGHSELLKALALVKQDTPHFRLLLVGEDDPRATPGGVSYIAQLKEQTQELGLTDQIIFTGFRKDTPQIFAACDIFTMPSYEEPFGMVFLEAMASQRPVAALDNGGTREVVEHGKSGLLSPYQDSEQLAKNVLTLMRDSEMRRQMGKSGRERTLSYFNPQRLARDTEELYQKII
ncbi:MAG: hypothetical protein OHK0029_24340 [Armatimonadaceae bacterium]